MHAPPTEAQVRFWDEWNATHRETRQGEVSQRQAATIEGWLDALGDRDLTILDVGCGTGWFAERLSAYGTVTATDLAGEVLARAQDRRPDIRYVAGDFMALDFSPASYDLVTVLEVLSHVADPPAFMARVAGLLRPGGRLMLANQNRFVLSRASTVRPAGTGQIRNWTTTRDLRRLCRPHFHVERLTSVLPYADRGLLRWTQAPKLNRLFAPFIGGQTRLDRLKERVYLGHTLMLCARKR